MTEPIIDIRDVNKAYDRGPQALSNFSIVIQPGESVAILGRSGSGKSTLLNLIAGLDRPSSGTVTVGGTRVDTMSETASAKFRRSSIGMVFQFFNLLDDLTVLDNILLPAQVAGRVSANAAKRAGELLAYLGIERQASSYPGRLSGGERQRAAVARALINRPSLLLADEPTGALDSASSEEVRSLLADLNRDGQTIVLVTHDDALAQSCATRTIELVDGRIARDIQLVNR